MQAITVAIADADRGRQVRFEHALQSEEGIRVLTNVVSNTSDIQNNRRLKPRANISTLEDTVARVRRLKPRVLLANMEQCLDEDCAMLVSLQRECPETLVVLLADEPVRETELMQALASGARGCLDQEATSPRLSKVVHMVDRGEAWVPRKMLGKIMDEVMHWCDVSSPEVRLDSAC
jgi:DNA-binding NarL/FixJ family response regulator